MHSLLNKNKSTLKKPLRNMCTLFCFFFETVFQVCVSFQSFVSFMFRRGQLSIFLSSAKGGKLRQNTGPHYVHFLLFFSPYFSKNHFQFVSLLSMPGLSQENPFMMYVVAMAIKPTIGEADQIINSSQNQQRCQTVATATWLC